MKINNMHHGRFILSTLSLALLGATTFVHANTQTSDYVSEMSLSVEKGINSHAVMLKNVSASKHIDAIQIQAQQTHVAVQLKGHVYCTPSNNVKYETARAYFGPISMFVDSIQSQQALFHGPYHPTFTDGKSPRIAESGNHASFNIPLAQIKQGHPAVRFDPLEELDKRLQQHLAQGGTKLDFYKEKHTISIQRVVSLAGWCKHTSNNASKPGYASTTIDMTVIYEGDPALTAVGVISQQLGGGNMPDQIAHDLPFTLNTATFQPNMPHYIGKCAPDSDPVIRINFSGNGKGVIRFIVEDNGSPVFGTTGLLYDSAIKPSSHLDFKYPLIAKLAQENSNLGELNKTYSHPLTIKASFKDQKDINTENWSEWQEFGSANWNHRCIPQVSVSVPGSKGGYSMGENPTPPSSPAFPSPSRIAPIEAKPSIDSIQMPAPKPTPTTPSRIQGTTPTPTPELQLKSTR